MTREKKQKAIDALKISAPIMAVTQEEFTDYIQTLNKIMDWLEQEPCEDAISRQAALKLFFSDDTEYTGSEICNMIHELPSVNPQEPKTEWIPIKEKRPNDPEDYIVTINIGDVNCVVMDYYSVLWGCFEGYGKDVIAWMPLPKPYKPNESEDKE